MKFSIADLSERLSILAQQVFNWKLEINMGVVDGTRTRNNQNHNLGLYH